MDVPEWIIAISLMFIFYFWPFAALWLIKKGEIKDREKRIQEWKSKNGYWKGKE